MEMKLEWQQDEQTHILTIIDNQSVTVGRQTDCDLVLDDPRVSRQHALIFVEDNNFHLRNLSQTNSIFLHNGAIQLTYNQTIVLKPGQTFQIGFTKLRVKAVQKVAADKITEPAGSMKVQCPGCQKRIDFHLKDCPWCGASLAHGLTIF